MRSSKSLFKYCGSTVRPAGKLVEWRIVRGIGTVGVAVKCVDINWNTEGEGRYLEFSWRWDTKARVAKQIRDLCSPSRKLWMLDSASKEYKNNWQLTTYIWQKKSFVSGQWSVVFRIFWWEEEGGADVKSAWPLYPGLHTPYNGEKQRVASSRGQANLINFVSVRIGVWNSTPWSRNW